MKEQISDPHKRLLTIALNRNRYFEPYFDKEILHRSG